MTTERNKVVGHYWPPCFICAVKNTWLSIMGKLMSEQYRPNIGELPDELARRDAIHIAVAPLMAGCKLTPGENVWVVEGVGYNVLSELSQGNPVGIVDPFLRLPGRFCLEEGERFWLFIFPNTITNLRHVWEHPAFKLRTTGVEYGQSTRSV